MTAAADRAQSRFGSWYYPSIGVLAAGTIVASMYLPQSAAGVSLIVGAVLVWLVDRFTPNAAKPWRGTFSGAEIVYVSLVAVLFIVSLVLVWTVVRESQMYWLGWTLAALTFVSIVLGPVFLKTRQPSRSR